MANGYGLEVVDLCLPSMNAGRADEFVTASFALPRILEEAISADPLRGQELSCVESDGTRLALAGSMRGRGAFVAERIVDLPGASLLLVRDVRRRRGSLGRSPGPSQSDGGLAGDRIARARLRGPHHLRQPRVLRNDRVLRRRIDRPARATLLAA